MPQWEQMYVYNIDNILYIYIYYQQYFYEGLPCLNLVDIDCRLWVSSLVSVYIYIWVGWEDFSYFFLGVTKQKNSIKRRPNSETLLFFPVFWFFWTEKKLLKIHSIWNTLFSKPWLAVKPALRWGCRKVKKYDLLVLAVLWCIHQII